MIGCGIAAAQVWQPAPIDLLQSGKEGAVISAHAAVIVVGITKRAIATGAGSANQAANSMARARITDIDGVQPLPSVN